MKKTLKALALALVMGLIIISLTGCGGNKLVATKKVEDEMMGNYKEEIVMTFKDDKVETIEMSMEFDDEKTAENMAGVFGFMMSMPQEEGESLAGMNVKQDGKKLVITMDAKTYAQSEGASEEEMTKEALKAALEEEGYTVK